MTDYFKKTGLSSGNLRLFYNNGNHFPEMVLQRERLAESGALWCYDFERGNALEYLCVDVANSERLKNERFFDFDLKYFNERFFVSEQKSLSFGEEKGKRSKASGIAYAVSAGETDLEKYIVMTGKGVEHKTYKNTVNTLARECMEHPGRIPMTQSDFALLLDLAKKICLMPVPREWLNVDATFGELFRLSEYQREFYWQEPYCQANINDVFMPIEKKGLPDFTYEIDHPSIGQKIAMPDIKYTGNLSKWLRDFKSGGWIQGTHYETGARVCTGLDPLPYLYVIGVAGDKHTPTFATYHWADLGPCTGKEKCFCRECRQIEYDKLCAAYHQWEIDGKPERGWLTGGGVKIWV